VSLRDLTEIEIAILRALDHVGWCADLWFPIVQRDMMNFGVSATEEEIHSSFLRLLRDGLIREVRAETKSGQPDVVASSWEPDPDALAELQRRERARWQEIRNTGPGE
jgi:hypothetical protein